jgi:hypothetical protein
VPVAQGDRAGGHVPVAHGERAGPHVPVAHGDGAAGGAENQAPGMEVAGGKAGTEEASGMVNVVGIVEEYAGHADAAGNVGNDGSMPGNAAKLEGGVYPGKPAEENNGAVAVAVVKEVVGNPRGAENEGNAGSEGAPKPYPAGKAEKSGADRLSAGVSKAEEKAGMVGKKEVGKLDPWEVMGTGPDSVRVKVGWETAGISKDISVDMAR